MRLESAVIYQLPRVAAIESMTGEGRPLARDKMPIHPWSVTKCPPLSLRDGARCVVAKLSDRHHVEITHVVDNKVFFDCSQGIPHVERPRNENPGDSVHSPDYEGPICAGTRRDLFPATTVYIVANFVDPAVKHYDAALKKYVVGPVTSKVFYQFSGIKDVPAAAADHCRRRCLVENRSPTLGHPAKAY